jgi:hypothetical protein
VAGGAGFTLLVVGSNFLGNSVVNYNGVARQTTFLNPQQLTIAISSGDIANPGMATITVTNPASGAGGAETTNPVTLTILAANLQPVVGTLIPASATAGGPSFTLTLTGNNFTANSIVTFGGSQLSPTFLSVTELQVNIPSSAIAVAGTPLVTVANPGGNPSVAVSFTVNSPVNPVPAATSISPSSVPAGNAAITLTVTGANFVQGSTVQVNNTSRTTTFVSPTSLTAALLASDFSHTGTLNVTVNNPNPGGGTTSPLVLSVVADFDVTATSQSAIVPAGQTANYSLMLSPANGQLTLNGAVTFSISSTSALPPGTNATFTPMNVPAGSAGTNVMLAIATTPHSSGSFVVVWFGEWPHAPFLLGAGLAIGMMWFALGTLRSSARRLAPLWLILLLLTLASGLTACGISGGGGGSSGPQVNTGTGTPAGNYAITVNAMSGNTTVPTTVTLTVK